MRWAEALAIERLHGDDAPRWIAERIGALIEHADADGVERMLAIAARLDRLLKGKASRPVRNDGGSN